MIASPGWTFTRTPWSPACARCRGTRRRGNAGLMRQRRTGFLSLLEWLSLSQCGLAAMEATGVYWVPVWKILSEGDFELLVANAAHIKSVPGRKTDMNDAMWIADLAAPGLIKAGFDPAPATHPEDFDGGEHSAGFGDQRRHGRKRATDDRGDDRRRARPAQIGGAGRPPGES